MISDRICQLCGKDVGESGPQYIQQLGDIPFCMHCSNKIKKHLRMHFPIIVDGPMWTAAKDSPVKLLKVLPCGVRRKGCIYIPD